MQYACILQRGCWLAPVSVEPAQIQAQLSALLDAVEALSALAI
jgi:hypothetical protein